MPFLLDTHVILWALEDGAQLSSTARQLMTDPTNELLISETSLFGIVIKLKTNKLTLSNCSNLNRYSPIKPPTP